jgi:hypothetical protein
MEYQRLVNWEQHLKEMFDEIDDELEGKYGKTFPLHPARPGKGRTSSREQDGLFNVGASFSAGFGSRYGRGYVIDIDMITLARVPHEVRQMIEDEVILLIRKKLPRYFPERNLKVARDGHVFKIYGDLSL